MIALETLTHFASQFNLPLCLYAALGTTLVARAYIDRHAHHGIEAREHAIHGLIYICLGLAK